MAARICARPSAADAIWAVVSLSLRDALVVVDRQGQDYQRGFCLHALNSDSCMQKICNQLCTRYIATQGPNFARLNGRSRYQG
jgi:hypothetical protein